MSSALRQRRFPFRGGRARPPRVVIARPDHLGDVWLTLPAATTIRRAIPGAQVAFLVRPETAAAPRHCPDVTDTLTAPFPSPAADFDREAWQGPTAVVARLVARARFDVAILARPADPWSGAILAAAGVPHRIGYVEPATLPFLTEAVPRVAGRHAAEEAVALAMRALAVLGVRQPTDLVPVVPPRWRVTPSDAAEADQVLARVAEATGDAPIILHPGAGWRLKRWPAERWGALAAAIHARYGVAPLVTAGPQETLLAARVVECAGGAAVALPAPISLGGLAALHQRARVVVATDSGPLHLAAAVGAPVVGLYGPSDPAVFGPLAPAARARVVRVSLPCSPCGLVIDPPCGAMEHPACVIGVDVGSMLAAVAAVLR